MSKLTVRQLDAARPKGAAYKLSVDRGLYLNVAPSGEKRWVVRYVVDGKRRDAWLPTPYGNEPPGTHPGEEPRFLSLADAVTKNGQIQAMARNGVDFQEKQEAERQEAERAKQAEQAARAAEQAQRKTVQDLFDAWVTDGVARKDGNAELKRLFSKDVLPEIGGTELRKLTAGDLLALLRKMMARGVIRQAVLAFGDISQMLHWGEKRQPWRGLLIDGNPADLVDMNKLLPADYDPERDRVLSPAEIRELAGIFQRMDEDYANATDKRKAGRPVDPKTRIALWICLGTLCRIGELLMAEWRHVDLDVGVWFIPAANTKGQRGKRQDHYVFLSDFAKHQFKALHAITGESTWLFPAKNKQGEGEEIHVCVKSVSKQVGDRQEQFKQRSKPPANRRHDNSLVLAGGANGEWTPHDLRRTGATMMQAMGISLDIIDRCQNHVLPGKVRRVYLRHDYQVEKTDAWNKLGNRLDAILAGGADIVQLRRAS